MPEMGADTWLGYGILSHPCRDKAAAWMGHPILCGAHGEHLGFGEIGGCPDEMRGFFTTLRFVQNDNDILEARLHVVVFASECGAGSLREAARVGVDGDGLGIGIAVYG